MLTALIITLIVGAVAGWLAGLVVNGTGFRLVGISLLVSWTLGSRASCFRISVWR
jgi:uncharacterized membrane protein YeaQ/YmgE (transglycosylase-associated protein family)